MGDWSFFEVMLITEFKVIRFQKRTSLLDRSASNVFAIRNEVMLQFVLTTLSISEGFLAMKNNTVWTQHLL